MQHRMSAIPSVTSNDSALESAVVEWLLASRMTFPQDFRIRLSVVDSVGSWEDNREVFLQGDVAIQAGEPTDWVHLNWRTAPAHARVEAQQSEAFVEVSREAVAKLDYFLRSFVLVTLIFIWKRAGHYHVHAASAIDSRGRG